MWLAGKWTSYRLNSLEISIDFVDFPLLCSITGGFQWEPDQSAMDVTFRGTIVSDSDGENS